MDPDAPLLLAALRRPSSLLALTVRQWERLLILGRRHGVSGRWHAQVEALGGSDRLPPGVGAMLRAEDMVAGYRVAGVRWEVNRISHALAAIPLRPVFLKGAAYILTGLPCGNARLIADIDVLVPQAELGTCEQALVSMGWRASPHDDYDEAYYRRWMHELPPMQHAVRGTVVDIHHNIVPPISGRAPSATDLLQASVAAGPAAELVLAPADMLMHSIVHGFMDGVFGNGLRDVLDVHELATYWAAADADFWNVLQARISACGFERPALHALTAAHRLFATTVPAELLRAWRRPVLAPVSIELVHQAIKQVLVPALPPSLPQRLAARLLQVRSHWNKMPLATLARHLAHKLILRWRPVRAPTGSQADETAPET